MQRSSGHWRLSNAEETSWTYEGCFGCTAVCLFVYLILSYAMIFLKILNEWEWILRYFYRSSLYNTTLILKWSLLSLFQYATRNRSQIKVTAYTHNIVFQSKQTKKRIKFLSRSYFIWVLVWLLLLSLINSTPTTLHLAWKLETMIPLPATS